jgi:hypothetical protein
MQPCGISRARGNLHRLMRRHDRVGRGVGPRAAVDRQPSLLDRILRVWRRACRRALVGPVRSLRRELEMGLYEWGGKQSGAQGSRASRRVPSSMDEWRSGGVEEWRSGGALVRSRQKALGGRMRVDEWRSG